MTVSTMRCLLLCVWRILSLRPPSGCLSCLRMRIHTDSSCSGDSRTASFLRGAVGEYVGTVTAHIDRTSAESGRARVWHSLAHISCAAMHWPLGGRTTPPLGCLLFFYVTTASSL